MHADAIARHHGSQCGFCTPGMVVACHAALSKHEDKNSSPSKEQMEKALDGNLCRCTGYRPILDACKVSKLPNSLKGDKNMPLMTAELCIKLQAFYSTRVSCECGAELRQGC